MKYSCSAPTEGVTFLECVLPNNFKIRNDCSLIASIERRSGVFWSQSHAVYPLASNVARSPPEGNEEASGSPLINSLPENSIRTFPFSFGAEMKESCFSAVVPVNGWNQCV